MAIQLSTGWQVPSNIALVKYWGKYGNQLPANPSLSFTLQNCHTRTVVHFTEEDGPQDPLGFSLKLDGVEKPDFKPKVATFIERILPEFEELKNFSFSIHTTNSFPHSSGIASSASAFGALAMCFTELRNRIIPFKSREERLQVASRWARLGSGSACRSLYGGLVLWGEAKGFEGSSQEHAIPFPGKVNHVFSDFKDTVLLVEKGQKSVSSTAGHEMMDTHPFAELRYSSAKSNLHELANILATGDVPAFGALVEHEALMLHGLMMSGKPGYLLMKPNTLAILEKIWAFRRETDTQLYFTLDAGANVHLLYPAAAEQNVLSFVESELSGLCGSAYIRDEVGTGPQPIAV